MKQQIGTFVLALLIGFNLAALLCGYIHADDHKAPLCLEPLEPIQKL